MRAATRRGFLAGALGAGAVLPSAVARGADAPAPAPAPVDGRRPVVRRGRAIAASPHGGWLVVAHDLRTTIAIVTRRGGATRLVDVGGQPLHVAVAPDGRTAAVTTASWERPGVAFVDLAAGRLTRRVDAGPAPRDVAFTPDGTRAVVTGGEQEGTLHVIRASDGAVLGTRQIGLVPRGVAVTRGGRSAWVALEAEDKVVRVDLVRMRVAHEQEVPRLPGDVALAPDGRRLLVTHGGRDAAYVSEVVPATGRVLPRAAGPQPSAVAWTRAGARVIAVAGSGEVVVIPRGGRRVRRAVGGSPRALALAAGRAYVADWLTDEIRSVRL